MVLGWTGKSGGYPVAIERKNKVRGRQGPQITDGHDDIPTAWFLYIYTVSKRAEIGQCKSAMTEK
jgi:hypothetical protein